MKKKKLSSKRGHERYGVITVEGGKRGGWWHLAVGVINNQEIRAW